MGVSPIVPAKPSWCLRGGNIVIDYGTAKAELAVRDVSIELTPGTVTALVGPNGSGKSTLLRGLSRLQRLTRGTVAFDDVPDVSRLGAKEFARRVGMLSQSRPTPSDFTVLDAVEFGRHPHRTGWRGNDIGGSAAVRRAIEMTDLTSVESTPVESLSGGQLQRVWFASALAQETSVLLLDEPTNHLDLRYQIETLELIRRLADDHDIAVGVVLHDLNHAAALADQILVLSHGVVVSTGAPRAALTADVLSQVYDIEVQVEDDPALGLQVYSPRQRVLGVLTR